MLNRRELEEVVQPEFESVQDRLDEQSVHLMTIDLQLEAIRIRLEDDSMGEI